MGSRVTSKDSGVTFRVRDSHFVFRIHDSGSGSDSMVQIQGPSTDEKHISQKANANMSHGVAPGSGCPQQL